MELKIEDIKLDDNMEDFKSDNPSLNTYVQREAYFEHIMKFTNTKIVRAEDNIAAYFSIQFKDIKIIEDFDEYNYPSIYLKCLAVDKRYESHGIGTALLEYITIQCEEVSKFVGCRCLLIDALTEKAKWYEDRGFQYLDSDINRHLYDITIPMFIDLRNNELLIDYFEEG